MHLKLGNSAITNAMDRFAKILKAVRHQSLIKFAKKATISDGATVV